MLLLICFVCCAVGSEIKDTRLSINHREAKSFLTRTRRSAYDCTDEYWCEENIQYCTQHFEEGREEYCPKRSTPCGNGTTCYLFQPCYNPVHPIVTSCTEDLCMSFPCENGGNCSVINATHISYTCACVSGYNQSTDCATDYNECASNPCLNGGPCGNNFNQFTCHCTNRFEGVICEKDCRPGPADIVFVIDTSSSLKEDLNRSITFIREFVDKLPIGVDDFQIAVITFGREPNVLFDLDDYTNTADIIHAIDFIEGREEETLTVPALQKAVEISMSSSSGSRLSSAYHYIVLLYDGLSSDPNDVSTFVQTSSVPIFTVGIGHSILHNELLTVSGRAEHISSPSHFNDLYNRFLREIIHTNCNDCTLHTEADVIILLDINNNQTNSNFISRQTYGTRALIDAIVNYNSDVNISMYSYTEEPDIVFNFTKDKDGMIAKAFGIGKDVSSDSSNTTHALVHIRESGFYPFNGGRSSARKFVVLISDGNWMSTDAIKMEIIKMKNSSIEVHAIFAGEDSNMDNLIYVMDDPTHVYYVHDANYVDTTSLNVLASLTSYYTCGNDIFTNRQ
ncbi:von Willebrand factor A domain-containing protein 2-like [Mytilus californianus]|uniref:von Willebrand factor A domain-containing protein 2-like n=1 Tax=Mytilus californianus TaxID=6549 RepID=UPI0022474484|nr:von Willebrand factor A domain-containing protein 2-like [Mytilus californianus]XP_052092768.1 von Willebrand factor A domain-containing protein 2-like [Mytilus californianus]XP_052092769.1 von Willebrand factor A domain-containing protein 2-like [Mytilus californianus]XP_052092770.1 von Willebrand factor A domain-containing protein 2-like [Mytilus californianus]